MPGHTDVCLEDYAPHAHPLSVTLTQPGIVRLRVVGQRPAGFEAALDSTEIPVTVTP